MDEEEVGDKSIYLEVIFPNEITHEEVARLIDEGFKKVGLKWRYRVYGELIQKYIREWT